MSRLSLADLKRTIHIYPIIDNHAHNLYLPEGLKETEDLIGITSEASDDALEDVPTSLAHLRATRMLAELMGLPEDSTWEEVQTERGKMLQSSPNEYVKKCLHGTQTLLLDDGYEDPDAIEPYSWHDKFTLSACKRIERIEIVASDILESMHQENQLPVDEAIENEGACQNAWTAFTIAFDKVIAASIANDDVVGFKSVVCYATGLHVDVERSEEEVIAEAMQSFQQSFLPDAVENEFEIVSKGMNDALVIRVCDLLTKHSSKKPFQFHTGLGSNNMSLVYSNPAHMQPLIDAYSDVVFVLLHASYPFTREAGYLASVYKNCYLDLGLVWPEISRNGQEEAIRQALELTPWSKLLWSTDGHYFPETFYLANAQGRLALEVVMTEYVERRDLTVGQAIRAVKDIFFNNSNRLYGLGLEQPE